MIVPDWSAALSVGDAHLDEQHQTIFKAVARLLESLEAVGASPHSTQALATLRRTTVRHFVSEESLLEQVAFPGREAHRALHADLTRQLLELEAREGQGGAGLLLEGVQPLARRLIDHIARADQEFAPQLLRPEAPRPGRTIARDPFHLGIPTLDEDHQDFLHHLERLHQALTDGTGVEEARRMFPGLGQAFRQHTRREEMIMEMSDFPGLVNHRNAHQGLIGQLRDCESALATDPPHGVDRLLEFLRFYLTDHIAREDLAFAPYVQNFQKK